MTFLNHSNLLGSLLPSKLLSSVFSGRFLPSPSHSFPLVCPVTQKLYQAKIVPPGTIFAINIVPGGTILVAKSVPGSEKGPLAI